MIKFSYQYNIIEGIFIQLKTLIKPKFIEKTAIK